MLDVHLTFENGMRYCLFYYIGKCSYSSGTPPRIPLAILGVQSAGFALFYKKVCITAGCKDSLLSCFITKN